MSSKSHGYVFALLAICIFAAQDGFTKYLGDRYPPILVTMIRFWAFAFFVSCLAASSPGGIRKALVTRHPWLQVFRGILLVSEIVVMVFAYKYAGLAMSQSIFQATPLFITMLSIPLLGEKVGWRRGSAVVVGLVGVLIIINPVNVHFDASLLLPLTAAGMFAIYSIATRAVSHGDSAVTSVFYAGTVGAVAVSLVGPFYWTAVHSSDWIILGALCVCGALSHFFLIKAYALLPASEVQPVTYLQLVLNVLIAVIVFGESVTANMIAGALIVVGAGLFTVWREHRLGKIR
ncbi:DMT family transporter [Rhizobiaceae bacterium n13]|uniref:DMT family transporter n=1 Tax=Ferirhizobium litorale TaxID=2927786 RepID=A0AAE3QGJ4_9HYPH|nr:DMT family transporter [Fererhizobium litorale]MDI7862000.1 DMT family transporter [Fererhizobium litorale]MDI7922728.1 DMT family transporter [Fererhizobium litorale]